MQTHSARHGAERHNGLRHSRRARFWVGVLCVGIFGALALLAYAGIGRIFEPGHKVAAAAAAPRPDAAAHKGTGHLVWVGSDGCTVSDFDNLNGQLGTQRTMPCSQYKSMNERHKQSPLNRFKRFNSGFQK